MASTAANSMFVQARIADIDKVLQLIRAYYEFDGIGFNAAAIRRGLEVLLKDRSLGQVWMIRSDGRDAGYAILTFGFDLEFGGRQATITDLYLEPEWRRLGLGAKTILFLEEVCRELGVGALELQVSRDNAEARAFYDRMGFDAHDRVPLSKRLWEKLIQPNRT